MGKYFSCTKKNQIGFTLIELSIVLVVVGLVIGGIFASQEMIKSAQTRRIISQMEKFQLATSTFKQKYNCIAGDCPSASSFGLGLNGNGDTAVGGIGYPGGCLQFGGDVNNNCLTTKSETGGVTPYINRAFGEMQYYWVHLASAGLIEGSFSSLAINDAAVPADQMPSYFPRDSQGRGFLLAFSWNRKLYIRSGMSYLTDYKLAMFQTAGLDAAQMYYITSKYGYSIIVTSTNGYFDALAQGQRIVAIGGDNIYFELGTSPVLGSACIISNGSGDYVYNVQNAGNCNFMWQID